MSAQASRTQAEAIVHLALGTWLARHKARYGNCLSWRLKADPTAPQMKHSHTPHCR